LSSRTWIRLVHKYSRDILGEFCDARHLHSSAMQAALQGTLQLHLCGTLAVSRRMILIAQEGEKGKETKIPQKTMGLHPKPEER
jgi:hypothetical protein